MDANVTNVVIHILILALLLFLSAFFSSAETALVSINKIKMRTLAENGNIKAKRVLGITEDSGKMLTTILIGTNVTAIYASAITTSLALNLGGNMAVGIATGILTFVLLIFGELSPKTFATIHADRLAMAYSGIISFLMKVLTPLIFLLSKFSLGVLFLLRVDPTKVENTITEDEVRTIVEVSHETGGIESEERKMIYNVFDLGDAQAKDIMVPRVDVEFINISSNLEEVLDVFRENHYTRYPVYEESIDHVVGILNMKDLLLYEDRENFSVGHILREPYFTYENKNTAELLIAMRESSISIAIVLDEYGVTEGLVTLEDLLEEIVGEIRDEYDEDEEDALQQIGDLEYLVRGSMNYEDFCEQLQLEKASEDYDSIGGYMVGLLDHFPTVGESATTPDGVFLRVEEMEKNRIHKIFLRLPEKPEETQEEKEKNK